MKKRIVKEQFINTMSQELFNFRSQIFKEIFSVAFTLAGGDLIIGNLDCRKFLKYRNGDFFCQSNFEKNKLENISEQIFEKLYGKNKIK